MSKIIASMGLTNNSALLVWDVNDCEIVVSLNHGTRRAYKLYYIDKGVYFNYGGKRYHLSEFLRWEAV